MASLSQEDGALNDAMLSPQEHALLMHSLRWLRYLAILLAHRKAKMRCNTLLIYERCYNTVYQQLLYMFVSFPSLISQKALSNSPPRCLNTDWWVSLLRKLRLLLRYFLVRYFVFKTVNSLKSQNFPKKKYKYFNIG